MELGVFPSELQWPYMEAFPHLWKPQERMSPKTKTKNITSVYFKLLVKHQNRFGFIPQGSQDDVQGLIREPFSNRRCIWDFISRQCWFHIRHLQEWNDLQYIMYFFVYCLGTYWFSFCIASDIVTFAQSSGLHLHSNYEVNANEYQHISHV